MGYNVQVLDANKCKIRWRWVKGHQVQGTGKKWKVKIDINYFYDGHAEETRGLRQGLEYDLFFPNHICGIICNGNRLHESPREAILIVRHGKDLQDYIREKSQRTLATFHKVHWGGFHRYVKQLSKVKYTNVIKLVHN